jgi:hypothetical protein
MQQTLQPPAAAGTSLLTKVDHVTFVVRPDTIRKWAWFYIEVMGGKIILRKDDTNPRDKSSMMLWCIDLGEFGIALVAGIDREEKSHVTAYVEKHGDHAVQHVAFLVKDLETFRTQVTEFGVNLLGPILQRHDGFGYVRQVFARGYHDDTNPAEIGFPEFVERPLHKGAAFPEVSFSADAGTNLYTQAQHAMESDERKPLLDFSKMPADWEPPACP